MRARVIAAEAFFAVALVASVAVPALTHLAAGSGSSSGTSSGSSNGSSSGSSNGSSSGSSNDGTSHHGSSSGSSSSSSKPAPSHASPAPNAVAAAIPAAGTALTVTLRNLPPFVPLYCFAGVAGFDDVAPAGGPDLASEVAAGCAHIRFHLRHATTSDGSSSSTTGGDRQVNLKVDVEAGVKVVVVTPVIVATPENRPLPTIVAVVLILLLVVLLAQVLRRRRS